MLAGIPRWAYLGEMYCAESRFGSKISQTFLVILSNNTISIHLQLLKLVRICLEWNVIKNNLAAHVVRCHNKIPGIWKW